ncbi:FAD-dependent oxidoreductase [Quadrisphaera sp. GCM10027208]|uniref:FAD-dependent oxidoreductase n=1 Tax=Quadrisphaera sp. GCM10027208 TaxID=3273423 RepID=UPI003615882A
MTGRTRMGEDASVTVRRDLVVQPADSPLRVAIVGAGPAGIYAAQALAEQDAVPVAVDIIDRLPTPFGLVRYGIAPDHLKMRGLRSTLQRALEHPRVRFLGNVEVGVALPLAQLRAHVDAVIYAYGAADAGRLGIEGEELPGSLTALDLVSWYCGHPDADRATVEEALSHARSVAVIGVGNVALDVARVLARAPEELQPTEMPQHVLEALADAPVEQVTVVGRRGPAMASFSTPELRELGQLRSAVVLVDPRDLELVGAAEERAAAESAVARNLAVLRSWVEHEPSPGTVRLNLRFRWRPVRILGPHRVRAVELERTASDADGQTVGTGELELLPADLVVQSIGYRGTSLPGLPVDERTGTVAHTAGRVLRDGRPSPGEYVAGWIKRGPTGVVGTNKHDAKETVSSLLEDAAAGALGSRRQPEDLLAVLMRQGLHPVLLEDWRAIDAAEEALGATHGRDRTTLHDRNALLAAARLAAASREEA